MREQKRRTINNPARRFIPNGKQEEFIKLFGSDTHFVSLFCAANGVGKSSCGANILTNILFGQQNKWFAYPLFQKWPYEKRGRIISDPTTIKTKIIPELEKWFPVNESTKMPEANFEMGKEGKNYVCKITTNTGWTLDLMSTEQDTKEFESADISLVWIDEPMPKDKFMATLARGRLGMVVIWTFTPLSYSAWIKEWMDEHADGQYADTVEAEMEDACLTHGVRGILKHENIKRIADGYPEDEKEARVFGKFGHLIGRVHKLFRRKIHVVKPFPLSERLFTTYMALDPHPHTADHVLYLSVDSRGRKYITGEVISEGGTKILYERMKAFEVAMHYRIEGRMIDPSAYNNDQHKEEASVGKQLFDLGMSFTKGSKDLMAGIKRTNDALSFQMIEGKIIVPPELYIFDTCPVTIKQLEEYVWQEWKGAAKDDRKASSRPRDKDDHQPENLHRLLLSEPTFIHFQLKHGQRMGNYETEMQELDPY
ncbi:hypothetical protein HY469_02200 [Candidatus Roizmanbacteria bacterium]|nr:hypothetical protein [Candidatus Roizmanbacteria bacterium]